MIKQSTLFSFSIIFNASSLDVRGFAESLGMTPMRTDDCDYKAGFLLSGETGSVSFFINTDGNADCYEIIGTALDEYSLDQIKPVFDESLKAIALAGGQVDVKRLVKPFKKSYPRT